MIFVLSAFKFPGVKKDGSSAHFFHRTFNAYATGHRKRRKILSGHNLSQEDVRWHKTGKTRPVVENDIQKGFKKIMVLYKSSKKGLKPVKTNWVMHQYHLGTEEDEQEREFVVSKVFLQSQAKGEKIDVDPADVDAGTLAAGVSPITPKTHTPYPPRVGKNCRYDEGDDDNQELLFKQVLVTHFFSYIYQSFLDILWSHLEKHRSLCLEEIIYIYIYI